MTGSPHGTAGAYDEATTDDLLVPRSAGAGRLERRRRRAPNLILINADDLGWKDVGYQGSDFYETPNIDRLATEGMVFTAGYAGAGNCARAAPVCCPASTRRATGFTPSAARIAGARTDAAGPDPEQRRTGRRRTSTLAEALKSAGYATALFGKWHLDGKDGATPRGARVRRGLRLGQGKSEPPAGRAGRPEGDLLDHPRRHRIHGGEQGPPLLRLPRAPRHPYRAARGGPKR